MPGRQFVLPCQRHGHQAEERDDGQPHLEAVVVLVPVVHGEDDQGGAEEQLHVAHQVPSLSNAGVGSAQVGNVEDSVVPVLLALELIVQRLPREGSLRHKVAFHVNVESDDQGQGYRESAVTKAFLFQRPFQNLWTDLMYLRM